MGLFEIIACVAFVLGLINAFFLLSLAKNFDHDLSELDSRKVNNTDLDAHKKIMRQSLQVIHDAHERKRLAWSSLTKPMTKTEAQKNE